ncbi:hypothetical protein [Exiguobacterium sp. MH3]|uniref:hypothetical protein n=1 Tax=Exiguobacterium sp. MH3 TaxID=1399115 RepID=UPI0003C3B7C9|nr:hypothetical protein [Exiguobacterium sp. MH3]AHA31535.1 hypothetical protein U719_14415 [Exiguobacterium sp. MH3]
MKKSMTWTALVTLGLSSAVYLSPVEAATDEFTVETKNIHTRTEVLKGKAPAGSIVVLQSDDTEEEDLQEVAHAKADADGNYSIELPEEGLIGEDFYDYHQSDSDEYDYDYDDEYEDDSSDVTPNYFLEVVSVDDYTGDDDGMEDDWDDYYVTRATSHGDDDGGDDGDGDDDGDEGDEPGEDDGDTTEEPRDPISYDLDPIDLTVRTFIPKAATVDTKTLTRTTRTVTGSVSNKDVRVEAYVYHKSSKSWKLLGKAKPRSNGSYKMSINKKLYKKDASVNFYVVGNRDADGFSKALRKKYK